jgi:N-acetylglucosamine-6-sulfatase
MTNRSVLGWTMAAACVACLAACDSDQEPTSPPVAGDAPNIVLVMTDDQDLASLRAMSRTRRLLARPGTTFENAFASLPLCCPSRATLLTGQYAHNHGVFGNKPPDGGYQAFRGRRRTLGVWLEAAGYQTAWIGKYLNGYGVDGDPSVPPGWTRWFSPLGFDSLRMYNYSVSADGEVEEFGDDPADYQTDVLAREALRFIRERSDERPFFLALAPLAPHDEDDTVDTGARDPRPAPRHLGALEAVGPPRPPSFDEGDVSDKPRPLREPPLSARELTDLRQLDRSRRESLLAVDEAVGRIVRALRDDGELEDTVIVFTSDNGYLLGQHRLVGGKSLPYRGIAGVPLIVRGPGFDRGGSVRTAVTNVDLAATVADLAGLEPDRDLDGTSLRTLAREPRDAQRAVLLESDAYAAVRTSGFLYVEHSDGEVELYDLRRDPFELANRANAPLYRQRAEALARALGSLRECRGLGCDVPRRRVGS